VSLSRREFLAAAAAGTAVACGLFDEDGPERIEYGDAPSQFGDLYLPGDEPRGTVVLVHGGAWAVDEDLSLVRPVARDLKRRGYGVWNVEYRRVGEPGGGWPGTFDDVGAAVDHVAALEGDHPVDPGRVVVVGHSAGGTLALWAGGRQGEVTPVGVMSLAGFTDLEACVDEDLLAGACSRVLGGTPDEVAARYLQASPLERLPIGLPQSLVHGVADDVVPVRQSEGYAAAARAAGDPARFVPVPDAGHFQVIDTQHPAYREVISELERLFNSTT
jgi:acetyl esterase/lipase